MSAGIPAWVRAAVRTRGVRPPLGHTLRAGVCVGVPVALGSAVGHAATGVTIGLACVLRAVGEREASHRRNATTLLIATPIAACGYLCGPIQDWPLAALVPVMAAVAYVAASLAVHGEGFALGSMQVLLVASIALGVPDRGTADAIGWFLVGAGTYAALMAVDFVLVEPRRPERVALGALDDAVQAFADRPGVPTRTGAHAALAAARRIPTAGWAATRSGIARWGAYAGVVDAADDLVAWEAAGGAADPARRASYQRAREAWSSQEPSDRVPDPGALVRPPRRPLRDRVVPDRRTRAHAARLALCFGLAVSSRGWVGLDHWFWVPATVGLVMQPDFGSVFGRAVLRVVGTVAGSALAVLVLWAVPDGVALGIVVGLIAAAIPWAKQASYALQSTALAAVVLLLVDQLAPSTGVLSLPVQRVAATAVGGAIVLVFGYLLWPSARRPVIGADLAAGTDGLARLLRTSAEPVPSGREDRAARRRRAVAARQAAFDHLAATRVPLARAAAEPPPASTDAAAWTDAVAAVEALGARISDHAIARLGGAPPAGDVDATVSEIEALGRLHDPMAVEQRARALRDRVAVEPDIS